MMKSFAWLLLFGLIVYVKAIGWHYPTHIFDGSAERDPYGHRKKFEDQLSDLWEAHTVAAEGDNDASFNITINGDEVHSINGKTMRTNLDQRLIYAFQGFRYGKVPNRVTKFKPPIAEDFPFWEGDQFDATHIGFKCPQNSMIGHTVAGNIDCLYLNVYTPFLPTSPEMVEANGLPVMFFIHGGSFLVGDASMYLPTKLLDQDVILVTIHYRMGAQGFLTLNNADAPGNTALYDMVEALKWVRTHIEDFGGDRDRVTIIGESAGSVAVNYLMLTPIATGLFSSVIAESGSALDYWAIDEEPSYAANFILAFVGCDLGTDAQNFECLLDVSEEDLVLAQNSLVSTDRKNGYNGFRGCAPTLQQDLSVIGIEPFITRNPQEILYSGDYAPVPFMTGANRDEGSFVVGIMFEGYLEANGFQDQPVWMREEMIQMILLSEGIVDNTRAVEESLTNYYCPGKDLANLQTSSSCVIDMVGALFLKAGSWQTCNFHSRHAEPGTTFHYSFEFESDDTMYLWLLGNVTWDTGITHSDELMYIFSMPATMEKENNQQLTEQRMVLTWTNFAKYGDPTPDEDMAWAGEPYNLPKWNSFNENDPHYMVIDNEWVNNQGEFSERWDIDAAEQFVDPVTGASTESMTSMASDQTMMASDQTMMASDKTMMSDMVSDQTMMSDMQSMVSEQQTMMSDMQSMVSEQQTMMSDMQSMASGETMMSGMSSMASMASSNETMMTSPSETMKPETTVKPEVTTPKVCYTQAQYDDIDSKRVAYMATMIVFIILFVVAAGGCIFLVMKNR